MVITCLGYDKWSILTCSLTCYSWYIAAVPQLHHSLTTDERTLPFQTLEITAESVTAAGNTALDSLRTLLPIVASPMSLDLVITYWNSDVDIARHREPVGEYRTARNLRHRHRFTIFRVSFGWFFVRTCLFQL